VVDVGLALVPRRQVLVDGTAGGDVVTAQRVDLDEAPGPIHPLDCNVWTSHDLCNLNCVVLAALAQVVPAWEQRCARKGGCKTVAIDLFTPVVAAFIKDPPALFDPLMVALWVFVHKLAAHVRVGWSENGRGSIACAAFAPVAAAYRGEER
jgi:hypothetical protein